ncbi:lipoate--protein ligase family protein [Paenarthrobacter ureafaciens]|jgi:lipoate-protein ligase A|uniref:lipoate--protein ligase family protein n=1 Tax=Paenarthrobacter ureafaciens TaxID=37931 RepID=UPI0008A6F0E4|nr:lipoate--protein ligase [Paenarthrobacter ureafaciens]AOY71190.1 lipoate-protein ligase A [Arthrobacter sp. ZXY-2]UOD79711.1 lipoate--protein ligase family protein [Paenarthrobacter ureafaciens]WNZ04946.1 lipoate--protein ligase family protein [Paenarthrobacter ureafaciens]
MTEQDPSTPQLPRLTVYRQPESLGAAEDLDFALELLQRARSGRLGPSLRLYRPLPTVAFGQRDANLPGFEAAADACRRLGFEPLVRKAGGRAAAYHQGTLVIDHIEPHPDAIVQAKARFSQFGELLAGALRRVGVHAAVGEIAGEYCPGEFSVHGQSLDSPGHRIKLIGTAQRVVSGGWLFSSVIVVEDSAPIREVLTASYAALGLEWDPATAGAANDLLPGLDVKTVEDAVVEAYQSYGHIVDGDFRALLA